MTIFGSYNAAGPLVEGSWNYMGFIFIPLQNIAPASLLSYWFSFILSNDPYKPSKVKILYFNGFTSNVKVNPLSICSESSILSINTMLPLSSLISPGDLMGFVVREQ